MRRRRRFDGMLREPEYPQGHPVRRVRSNGEIKWRGKLVDINSALAGEPVGLAEGEHGAQRVGCDEVWSGGVLSPFRRRRRGLMEPFRGTPLAWGAGMPAVDVIDKEKEVQVRAELPGRTRRTSTFGSPETL